MEEMTNADVANYMIRSVNNFGGNPNMAEILEVIMTSHRTLQQAFCGRFVLPYIRKMAIRYKEGVYDLRNKAACEICSEMWAAVKRMYPQMGDAEDTSLPMI